MPCLRFIHCWAQFLTMKKLLFGVATLATGVIGAFIIATATALWVVKADGKNFYKIISDIELVARFGMAIITFSILLILYARFVFCPLMYRTIEDE